MNKWHISIAIIVSFILFLIFVFYTSNEDNVYDIIIVGTGLAGLTAAHETYKYSEGKLKILILESQHTFGGNSKKATSGINLLNTPTQMENGIEDSYSLFYNDTYISSGEVENENLISTLVLGSREYFKFFSKLDINLSYVDLLGGHSKPRTHRPSNGTIGYTLTSKLFQRITHETNIEIKFNTTVTDLILDDNRIQGVNIISNNKKGIINTHTVILATGGFAYDFYEKDSLIKQYAPNLINYPTTNGIGSQGHGMKMAKRIGAKLIDMDKIQIHPTSFVNIENRFEKNKILAPELLRGVGGILINQKGKRFCNELGLRDYVTKSIIDNCEKIKEGNNEQYESFILLNQKGIDKYGKDIEFYINKGLLKKYENIDKIGNNYNIDLTELKKTLKEYNENKNKDEFGKEIFDLKFSENESIYIGIVTPAIHYTMGGIKINEHAEVLSSYEDEVIEGLFAAGEVTGGIHGKNRLGGNSLLDCAVFGKKAAESAIDYLAYLY